MSHRLPDTTGPTATRSTGTAQRSRPSPLSIASPSARSVPGICPKMSGSFIADLRREGVSVAKIAEQLKRSRSTIYRELKRNATSSGAYQYRPYDAHRQAVARRARHHRRRIDVHTELLEAISELLAQRWSPEQISRHLRRQHVNNPARQPCHESIYQRSTSQDRC